MTNKPPTILIVDDDAFVRDSVRRLANSLGYSAQSYAGAEQFLENLRPDVHGCIILDVQLPDLNGLELQARLVEIGRELPIIFLTGRGDIPMSVRAMKAGAVEFLTKPFRSEHLVEAIRVALDRDGVMHRKLAEVAEVRRRYETLSVRERQVMTKVIEGQLNKQIAADFGTSEATVKKQRGQVMAKMGANSVAELVRIGGRLGIDTAMLPK
ncbi:MAG TPA: response regulator [Polyangiaceae bacterium]|jgi:FixJ family two-component response regulator|nr:response regulator [Polyangiaceae bacterium]